MASETPFGGRSDAQLFAAAAAAVARSDDLDDSLAELLGLATEHLGANRGAVYILDQDHDELQLAVTLEVEAETASIASSVGQLAQSDDPLSSAMRSRHPLPVYDASTIAVLADGAGSAVLVPLVVRRDGIELALGLLVLGFPGAIPEADVLARAEPLADLAAVGVERALALSLGSERAEWFERLAHTDPLTGLANRRTLDRMLELELARAGRQGVALSIALLDVDRFEAIQRDGGHSSGDEALKRIAQVLSESVRLVDTVARYGGDEFMLVAPGPDGVIVAERLVRSIGALKPVGRQRISVSVGVATFPADGRTPDELVAAAERAMLRARDLGGGRVATIPGETAPAAES